VSPAGPRAPSPISYNRKGAPQGDEVNPPVHAGEGLKYPWPLYPNLGKEGAG